MKKTIVLGILDGIGLRDEIEGNAFKQAQIPFINYLFNEYPSCRLEASGESVGLLKGTIGNSEVGHMNIGAGKIINQPSKLINDKIDNKEFFNNDILNNSIENAIKNNKNIHILGLISDSGVHSLLNHLFALIDLCKIKNVNNLYIHGFSDGRDSSPKSALNFFDRLHTKLNEVSIGSISTISGRYYAMDRDNRWDRIEKCYNALVNGIGIYKNSYKEAILDSYENNITDEFIEPTIINKDGLIKDGDLLIVFNFRPDRLRELFTVFTNPNFTEFKRKKIDVSVVTMMSVGNSVICQNAFENEKVDMPLGLYISKNNMKQLRIAETEKYAHVTYFFDGGKELNLKGCKKILIPSPKVSTYDLTPKMSSKEITENLLIELNNDYDLVILNYSNGDMLGHTGNLEKTIESLEYLDGCIKKIYNKVKEIDGVLILTADHGNCEHMIENGQILTSHTTNKVPFIICDKSYELHDGKLSDIATTILNIINLPVPKEMDGNTLIK